MNFFKKILIFSFCSLVIYAQNITVSGAISLKEYLELEKADYEKIHPNIKIHFNFGASGTLKKQILNGAPVDIILLANKEDIKELENQNLVENSFDIFENTLVIIRHKGSSENLVALGDPSFVPLGKYSREALQNLNLWETIKESVIFAKDARAVLTYVERGEVDWGVIYKSDVKYLKNSFVEQNLDKELYSPIIYTLALVKESKNRKEAADFIEFLKERKERIHN